MVSDGSHSRDRMSFSWTFAVSDGTRIAECNGPGYGPGTSHRAKGYGVLSAVQFIARLQQFLMVRDPWKITFASDNQGLITRLVNRQQYTYVFPNSTLAPDWDLVKQIHQTLRTTFVKPDFQHVKGHQDTNTRYDDLDVAAQLNVDADRLAGVYHEDFPSAASIAPLLPSTGANLQLGNRTITSRYSWHIRNAAGHSEYVGYMRTHNDWKPTIWDTVDQVVLRRTIAHHAHQYGNVVKLIHDYLPTLAIRTYTDRTIQPTCELCYADKSTFRHVLRCPHHTRVEWRRNFLLAIQTRCESSTTRLGLMQAILSGLTQWFAGGKGLDPLQYSLDLRSAVIEQNSIGWYGFLRGLCSSRWAHLQNSHLRHNGLQTTTNTGTAWLISVVTTMWKQVFSLWEAYKTFVHGADLQTNCRHALLRIRTKIRLLHDRARDIRAADQQWLIPDLDNYLQHASLSQLSRWYATYEPVIIDAIKISHDKSVANTRSLRSYFPTVRQPRQVLQRAARIRKRHPRVHDARNQDKKRKCTPRPKVAQSSTILHYFWPNGHGDPSESSFEKTL